MNRHVFASADALAAELVHLTVEACGRAIAARGRFTMALTGGSAATQLYPVLAQARLPWADVHVLWGDERCVPPDHQDSNFFVARGALLSKVPLPEANVHRMRGELPPEQAATEYQATLERLGGLDVLHLGMGPDGHVLSLFPGHPLLTSDRTVAFLTDSPKPPPARVTLGMPAVRAARAVWFLVAGGNKAEAVREVLMDPNSALPAAQAARANAHVTWLLDESAARLVTAG